MPLRIQNIPNGFALERLFLKLRILPGFGNFEIPRRLQKILVQKVLLNFDPPRYMGCHRPTWRNAPGLTNEYMLIDDVV